MDKIKIFLFFITLLLWSFALAYPITPDYDLWARLIAGMGVIENGKVIMRDFYSYAPVNLIWLDHEWGASAFFYLWSKYNNILGLSKIEMLSVLKSLIVFLIFSISAICVWIRKPKNSVPFQILLYSVAMIAANIVFAQTIRCHMFSFLFFVILITLLELYRNKNIKKALFFIPILMLIWINTHGGCLSGFGILGIYTVGEFLNKKSYKPYIITLLISLITLFINPYGFDYVKFLFSAGTMSRELISEWQSPFLSLFYAFKFKLFFFFILLVAFIRAKENNFDIKNADKTKLLVLVTTAVIAVLHTKMLPFFVISSSIFMFDDIFDVLNKHQMIKPLLNPYNKIVYCIILLIACIAIQQGNFAKYNLSHKAYPYKAIKFIQENKISGNLFVEMTYGSYCAYKLYPQNKIFMDGRYEEVYNPSLLTLSKDFIRQDGYKKMSVIKDYPTDIVIIFNNEYFKNLFSSEVVPLVVKNLESENWHCIYKDDYWFVLVRPDYPFNKKIENKSSIVLDKKYFYHLLDTSITPEMLNTQ